MAAHSEIGASSAYRWTVCPGSVGLIRREKIPNITTEAAAEGTAAHELAADCLINGYAPESRLGEIIKVTCDATKRMFEIEIDQEMCDGVNVYRRAITELAEEMEGKRPTLCVLDFKYGSGKVVNVENNKQLMQYALGALISRKQGVEVGFDMSDVHPLMFGTADFVFANFPLHKQEAEWVRYGIVQPRADHPDGPVRYHEIHATDLIMYSADLKAAAEETDKPDAPLVPGVPQCDWCPAASRCTALHEYRKKAALMVPWPAQKGGTVVPQVSEIRPTFSDMTPELIAERMRIVELAEVACKAFREYAYHEANRGVQIPGWKLVEKQARRKWKADSVEARLTIKSIIDTRNLAIETHEPPKLKSPAALEEAIKDATPLTKGGKAEKEANKRLRESVLADLKEHYEAKSSGVTLVPVSDKRAPVQLLTAKDIFKPALPAPSQEEK